jgi:ABC-2 type transport system ATP-binding protein
MSSVPAAIEIRDLRKTYRNGLVRRKRVEALRGVSFEVRRGEIFGLLGPNGAGKTTLIKILLGIVRKSAGDATMLGWPAGDVRSRQCVGYLPEHIRIPQYLTANSALEYYGGLSGKSASEVKRLRGELLSLVGLDRWGKVQVKKYSKGMLQRLGLAQCMLHRPELLILDEPTDGVDPVGRSEMRDILKRLKDEGRTIFLNSHLLQEVELVCDRVAVLHQGRLLRVGQIDELTSRSHVDVVFELQGKESEIRARLQDRQVFEWASIGAEQFRAAVAATDQADLDRCIDGLRLGGISVCSMTRRRQTLEQVFLDLVKQAPKEAAGPAAQTAQ